MNFMSIEIINPKTPKRTIPIAETFEICSNSCLDGFFKICHTLLHFNANDFVEVNSFIK